MIRINLLPPETLERRRAEKRLGWVVLAALGVGIVLAATWGFGYFRVQGKQSDLAAIQQQVQATNASAAQLAVFEERASELQSRKQIATLALGDRRDWARIYDEISLVLPAEMWIQTMTATEEDGIELDGYALDAPTDTPDVGHKTIAKGLVRLADLEALFDVWLTSSVKTEYEGRPAIQFDITAKVVRPVPGGSAATVTVPAGEAGTP